MSNAQKALVMAAGIFLAIALITIAVVMFISAQEATKGAQESFSGIQNDLSSTSFTVYDNTVVSGSQVVNAIRKFENKGEFGIRVITGVNVQRGQSGSWYGDVILLTGGTTYGDVVVSAATNKAASGAQYGAHDVSTGGYTYHMTTVLEAVAEESSNFINPAGRYQAKVVFDKNNVVHGLTFDQLN